MMEIQVVIDKKTKRVETLSLVASNFRDESMLTSLCGMTLCGDVKITFANENNASTLAISRVNYSSQDDTHDPE